MRYLFFVFFIFLIIVSCDRQHDNFTNAKIFKYNESAGIRSLDPAFAKDQANIWAVNQIFNGLVQLDDSLRVKPCIAKSWELNADKTLYTFHLRRDVYFHRSKAFTAGTRAVVAADVKYSLNRIIDDKTASPGRWVMENIERKKNGELNINCLNDSTLTIKLTNPFSPFLSLLSMQYCSVVPKEAVDFYGKDFARNPIGTGPFKFQLWKENIKMVLLRNENYFEKDENGQSLPYLDGVSITFIAEKHTAFMEFMQGNYDMISGLDPNYKDVLLDAFGNLKPEHKRNIYMLKSPYLNTEYLGISVKPELDGDLNPLQSKKIRQAINYGFDRTKMMKYMRNNIGYPGMFGVIPPGLDGYSEDSSKAWFYSPEKTKSLLSEAGFPNGNGLPEIVLQTTASYLDLCEFMQKELEKNGIKIVLDVVPPATLREMIFQSKTNFFRGSWIADYPDAENYLSLFYSKYEVPNGPNYTHFSNAKYDMMYEMAVKEQNDSCRKEIYKAMNDIIVDEAPIVVLYYDMVVRFVNNRISGMNPNAMNLLSLKTVKK